MKTHPENEGFVNDLIEEMNNIKTGVVTCNRCGTKCTVNAAYLPYIQDRGLDGCRFCDN